MDLTYSGPVKSPSLTVVVPTRNRKDLAIPCLSVLIADVAADGDSEIIVVDHNSSDGLAGYLAVQNSITMITSDAPTVSALRNIGWQRARGAAIYFLDSDIEISPGQIRRIRAHLETDREIIGCSYALPLNAARTETLWHNMTAVVGNTDIEFLGGGNMAMSRQLLMAIEGFDERLLSGEDVDLCIRARRYGARVIQYEELAAMHHGNPKTLWSVFEKQLWHGSGAALFDRVAMFSLFSISAACALFWVAASHMFRVPQNSLLAVCLVVFAVAGLPFPLYYRWRRGRRLDLALFVAALPILWVYMIARSYAWALARLRRTI